MKLIKEIMNTNIITVSESETIMRAASIMKENDIGFLICLDSDNRISGVLTDRDIVIRGIATSCNTNIKDIMTKEVITVEKNTSLSESCRVLSKHSVRRLVVVEDKCAIGVVSIGDLLKQTLSDEHAKESLIKILSNVTTNHLYKIFDNSNYMDSVEVDDYKL